MIPITLPAEFAEKMRLLLADEWPAFRDSLGGERLFALRANTLKIPAPDLAALLAETGLCDKYPPAVPWCPEGFYYPESARPAKSPLYAAGLYYLQEPSAMLPAAAAGIKPGMRVLDLCAAPGGKSTQAAAALAGAGVLAANDFSASRCGALVKNLELFGCRNAVVVNEAPERLAERFAGWFDRVLADAPCSGEGMFRKNPDAAKSWEARKPAACAALQRRILRQAAAMTKPGGALVYSTCTFDPAEDEAMIDGFLTENGDFGIWPLDCGRLGVSRGRPEWGGGRPELAGCGRVWPHRSAGEGHFVCVMGKKGGQNAAGGSDGGSGPAWEKSAAGNTSNNGGFPPRRQKTAGTGVKYDKTDGAGLFGDFVNAYLSLPEDFFGDFSFLRLGQALYAVPAGLPPLGGLRVRRSGWYLGDVKTGRFEPSQALAMGLSRGMAQVSASFGPGDERTERFLRGESLDFPARDGWVLVCLGEFPLGWAKASGGRLKNRLARGWIA
ncbi:MAG: RsmB/NOP family class I SAM-dependent RNA methyltransferase [Firmicutes bacterium]|nr:RsmB/NOP family class I SAM-dependent RNA methyltransferase [Bacillota bacterium]